MTQDVFDALKALGLLFVLGGLGGALAFLGILFVLGGLSGALALFIKRLRRLQRERND